jgi:hypothetical protein
MATARTIQVTTQNTGLWHWKQNEAAAKKTTELLQEDLEVCGLMYNNTLLSKLRLLTAETPLLLQQQRFS